MGIARAIREGCIGGNASWQLPSKRGCRTYSSRTAWGGASLMSRLASSPGVMQHVAPRSPRIVEPRELSSRHNPANTSRMRFESSARSTTSSFRASRRIHSARSTLDEVRVATMWCVAVWPVAAAARAACGKCVFCLRCVGCSRRSHCRSCPRCRS